ncbi:hypothetical protein ACFW2Y_30625 [Streptomyces sp. NPDC058877]|uniref:hypothetical protein n=1 Tax=Streptomyces sp. NPDC058877 TaxID=3346665 RepID=UPI0036AE7E87
MSGPETRTVRTESDGDVPATIPDDDQVAAVARARRHVVVYLLALAGLLGALAVGILR